MFFLSLFFLSLIMIKFMMMMAMTMTRRVSPPQTTATPATQPPTCFHLIRISSSAIFPVQLIFSDQNIFSTAKFSSSFRFSMAKKREENYKKNLSPYFSCHPSQGMKFYHKNFLIHTFYCKNKKSTTCHPIISISLKCLTICFRPPPKSSQNLAISLIITSHHMFPAPLPR